MSSIFQNLQVDTYILAANDLESQLVENSTTLQLQEMQSTTKVQDVNTRYDSQEELIRAEMKNVENTSSEYKQLADELNSLEDHRDMELDQEEQRMTIVENKINTENTQLESQLEAINEDKQNIKEAMQENIQKEYGYFSN